MRPRSWAVPDGHGQSASPLPGPVAPFDRLQLFLLPPALKDWLPEDDIAHFIEAAVERVRMGTFRLNPQAGGKPQYHPRLMLALPIYSYANGIFSSRRSRGGPVSTRLRGSPRLP
jgi:hypothetical protein